MGFFYFDTDRAKNHKNVEHVAHFPGKIQIPWFPRGARVLDFSGVVVVVVALGACDR